jgi:hypothetical protein
VWLAICLDVMPIFMRINDILCVCILLACCLCFMTTMFMREGDQVKASSRVQLLAIISSLVTFMLFYLLLLNFALKGRARGKVDPTMRLGTCTAWWALSSNLSRSLLTSSSHDHLNPEKLTWQKAWVHLTS